jgi:hypothetical protein
MGNFCGQRLIQQRSGGFTFAHMPAEVQLD